MTVDHLSLCPIENYYFLHLSAKLLAPFVLICFFRCIMALFQMKMKNERSASKATL